MRRKASENKRIIISVSVDSRQTLLVAHSPRAHSGEQKNPAIFSFALNRFFEKLCMRNFVLKINLWNCLYVQTGD
jgi:hypothetical protein